MRTSPPMTPDAGTTADRAAAAVVIADFVSRTAASDLPAAVMHEAGRCFLNFAGCALSGGSHDMVRAIDRALSPLAGPGTASVIGQGRATGPLHAALLNGAA
ncbi:MAG: MmgE/PrpD family protein, partial [Comamonadaceae bacterium]